MFLRPHQRNKDGKEHTYWSLVETVRTVDGPRQKTLCYFGELNGSAQARWLPKTGSWTFSKTPLNQHKHWLNHHPRKMSCQKQQRSVYRGTKQAQIVFHDTRLLGYGWFGRVGPIFPQRGKPSSRKIAHNLATRRKAHCLRVFNHLVGGGLRYGFRVSSSSRRGIC
jgi:hypothetical protein